VHDLHGARRLLSGRVNAVRPGFIYTEMHEYDPRRVVRRCTVLGEIPQP